MAQDRLNERIFQALNGLDIELPSWGFADTGTRFGKFYQDAAAIDIYDKIADASTVHALTGSASKMAVHVLWDFSTEHPPSEVAQAARDAGIRIGSINPNLFQDADYKLGSFGHPDETVQEKALDHCLASIAIAKTCESRVISLWFADGSNYPGQDSVRRRKRAFEKNLAQCYAALAPDQTLLIEYKPFEPAFYHTDVADWGMALHLATQAGPQAKVLVDTGHHYSSQNIEQIVAWLLDEGRLGGFHFNDRRYADDDLTLGSIDPYQVFRIFHEIHAYGADHGCPAKLDYMVDQSHNLKPKIPAMIQTVTWAQELFAKACLVDLESLRRHQAAGRIIEAEQCLQRAFMTDVSSSLVAWRESKGLPTDPLRSFQESGLLEERAKERRARRQALGMQQNSAYA